MTLLLAIPFGIRLAALIVLGLGLGSLVNLAIYRLAWHPRAISPWSRPHPDAPPRRLLDRLPVVGWLGLRRESPLYGRGFWIRPMVLELAVGGGVALFYGWEVVAAGLLGSDFPRPFGSDIAAVLHHQYAAHVILAALVLAASWIDVDEKTIPDGVAVPGTLAGLVLTAVWPSSLLPDVQLAPGNVPMVNFVWLTSPNNPFPWLDPGWTGVKALGLGLGCFWLWCVALLPRRWYGRHGPRRAWRLLTARLARQRTTYAILAMGLLGSALIAAVWFWTGRGFQPAGLHWAALLSSLVGLAVGGGCIWIIRIFASALLHREAMGFGDVTLMAMIGAFLGWQAAIVVFFLAPFAAILVGLAQWILRGESEIPYGPFLGLAAAATVVAWHPIWLWAQNVFALGWFLGWVALGCLALMPLLLPVVRWVLAALRR